MMDFELQEAHTAANTSNAQLSGKQLTCIHKETETCFQSTVPIDEVDATT